MVNEENNLGGSSGVKEKEVSMLVFYKLAWPISEPRERHSKEYPSRLVSMFHR